jgi:hypothetical protein
MKIGYRSRLSLYFLEIAWIDSRSRYDDRIVSPHSTVGLQELAQVL